MKQCSICKEFFNPASLKEVVEHMHNNFELNKDYYGAESKTIKRIKRKEQNENSKEACR